MSSLIENGNFFVIPDGALFDYIRIFLNVLIQKSNTSLILNIIILNVTF